VLPGECWNNGVENQPEKKESRRKDPPHGSTSRGKSLLLPLTYLLQTHLYVLGREMPDSAALVGGDLNSSVENSIADVVSIVLVPPRGVNNVEQLRETARRGV
jgi:hypothetical protein